MNTIFFVIGYKGSGKDTVVGEALSRVFRARRMSCSDSIRPSLARVWADMIEGNRVQEVQHTTGNLAPNSVYPESTDWLAGKLLGFLESLPKDPEQGAKPHECSRVYQIAHGNHEAWCNSTHWIEETLKSGARVITGVRRRSEFIKAKTTMLDHKIVTVWCDRIGYKPDGADNLELTEDDAEIVIQVPTFPRLVEARIAVTDCVYIHKHSIENAGPGSKSTYHIAEPKPITQ